MKFEHIVAAADEYLEAEFSAGYRDGHGSDIPEPSGNRSAAYIHSFRLGRAERAGNPIPYVVSVCEASKIRQKEITNRMAMIASS
ncbi:MAG: hypothetical protein AAFP81_19620 [Pseudomonadota bacterium]